jgi:hypothetical protein
LDLAELEPMHNKLVVVQETPLQFLETQHSLETLLELQQELVVLTINTTEVRLIIDKLQVAEPELGKVVQPKSVVMVIQILSMELITSTEEVEVEQIHHRNLIQEDLEEEVTLVTVQDQRLKVEDPEVEEVSSTVEEQDRMVFVLSNTR